MSGEDFFNQTHLTDLFFLMDFISFIQVLKELLDSVFCKERQNLEGDWKKGIQAEQYNKKKCGMKTLK